jgi:hypothetical protein
LPAGAWSALRAAVDVLAMCCSFVKQAKQYIPFHRLP